MIKQIIRAGGWLLLAVLLVSCADAQANATTGSQGTRTANHTTPTVQATPTPTTKPTTIPGDPRRAILGGTLADFIARYGPLNSYSNPSKGEYYIALYGNGKDDLMLQFIYNQHADGILLAAPNNIYWTEAEARAACNVFLPSDAVYQRRMTFYDPTNGEPTVEQLVYYSPTIGKLFPANAFSDENSNPAKPGTIGVTLLHWMTTSYLSCGVQAGLQSK